MPQLFNNAVLTNGGANLMIKAHAGTCGIAFTRIVIGDGHYDDTEKTLEAMQRMSALKSAKASFPLNSIEIYSENSVKVTALITNFDQITHETLISEGFFINEMGLYAKEAGGDDSTEVLYSIVTTAADNGDFMPPYNGYFPAQIIQDFYVTVGNSAEVVLETGNDSVALAKDVQEIRSILKNMFKYAPETRTLIISTRSSNWIGDSDESAGGTYILPTATAERLGGVKIGDGIGVTADGTISTDVAAIAEAAATKVEENTEGYTEDEIRALFTGA